MPQQQALFVVWPHAISSALETPIEIKNIPIRELLLSSAKVEG